MDESPDGTLRFKHSFNIQHIPGKVNSTADFLSRCSNKSVCVCVCMGGTVGWFHYTLLHHLHSYIQLYTQFHFMDTLTLILYQFIQHKFTQQHSTYCPNLFALCVKHFLSFISLIFFLDSLPVDTS